MNYFVYILRCADDTLYTGITTDIDRRVGEHNGTGSLGAKYTRVRRPVVVVYTAQFSNRSEASREEARIKKMTREGKEAFISDSE
ncbi:MAG: GIY-YIG nuclease family protein [Candidatus Nomurabacteria bacterium]|nr:GIY-YIG nuclease family protein [Candidatus Nomurabacteria bacterium]